MVVVVLFSQVICDYDDAEQRREEEQRTRQNNTSRQKIETMKRKSLIASYDMPGIQWTYSIHSSSLT